MAKYRVLEKSFINNTIAEEGDVVEYDGKPGKNLELIEEASKASKGGGKPAKGSKDEDKGESLV